VLLGSVDVDQGTILTMGPARLGLDRQIGV
jgi:hypothetical protein